MYMGIIRKEKTDMTITIYEGYDKTYVMLGCKDKRFAKAWGDVYRVPVSNIYKDLEQVTYWCNNDLGEECLFEIG